MVDQFAKKNRFEIHIAFVVLQCEKTDGGER